MYTINKHGLHTYVYVSVRDRPIMLIFYLCCSAQFFDLLCSILCSCKRIVLKNLTVLLEYIHLYQKLFNMVSVLLEYIDLY